MAFVRLVDRWLIAVDGYMPITLGSHENYDGLEQARKDEVGVVVVGDRVRLLQHGFRHSIGGLCWGCDEHRLASPAWEGSAAPGADHSSRGLTTRR